MPSLAAGTLAGRNILLGITGSIAAYKIPPLARLLQDAGANLKVVMTASASEFVGAAVFRGFGIEVHADMWSGPGEPHIELATWADVLLIAPATADSLARIAQGRADDLLGALALSFDGPVLLAPAMHPKMWQHPATEHNVATLVERDAHLLGPAHGKVASGESGLGRMLEPEQIAELVAQALNPVHRSMSNRHLLITAGPTQEALDPVRSLTNSSSGKMGYSIAAAALARGAKVTLISGPVNLPPPPGAHFVPIQSALELREALAQALGPDLQKVDALIMAAAVSDYRPAQTYMEKLKRGGEDFSLHLTPNPDLLAEIGKRRTELRPVLVGFALETAEPEQLLALGRKKLIDKQVDLIVANNAADSLGKDSNQVQLVSARDCRPLPEMGKAQVAAQLLDWVEARLAEPLVPEQTH